ncbi:hypothetical protein ASPNIDRAFT_133736 [Aspergillus niger ATCC 1015]|uniref:Uncharacterized protein n=1 Tax=Aspergillus niger (strain ATCC 1015 / CBS 113.46 / FGSC A1144 / LSHB Ac4 / NCTC 3858a / NRRL 328 / USDA 3528.7) TaxID=380704 RepID=G3Y789_ASPNA|nr:hypothetical protein ASPNIDRAFT_133736 [Aspergillus niger ATCC 1015]
MAYYEPQGWQAPAARQASWEQPAPPSRSGSSSVSQRDEIPAFSSQFDEVDRAIDNLVKSGKLWAAPRRDSMPMMMGRPYPDYGMILRDHLILSRHILNPSLLAEMSGNKSDRSLSPAAMSEESRRELLARQHRALYGNDSPAFFPPAGLADDGTRSESQAGGTPTSSTGVRGASPRNTPVQAGADSLGQTAASAASLHTSSPSSAINPVFGKYDSADQPVTSTSSPGGADSPSSRQAPSKSMAGPIGSVGPIGTRPLPQPHAGQVSNPALNKRSTTPLPSPLGFGFTPGDAASDRSVPSVSTAPTTAAATASVKDTSGGVGLGWGNGSGVWGSKNGLGVQASVWG